MSAFVQGVRHRFRFPHKIAADLVLWTAATPIAFLLRFDLTVPPAYRGALWVFAVASAAVKLTVLLAFRMNLRSWRKVTFRDVEVLAAAVLVTTFAQAAIVVAMRPRFVVPISIPLIEAVVGLASLFAVRALRRWLDERTRRDRVTETKPTLIVGAGEAGTLLAREMLRHPETGLVPAGFVDDDPAKRGMRIGDVEVLGTRRDLPRVLRDTPVDQVLIAVPSADGRFIRETLEHVHEAAAETGRDVPTRVMPGVYELISGEVSIDRIRDVEVQDLLRRPAVNLDLASIRSYVEGRTVLVTGSGGSIGSEIARQLARFGPAKLLILGRGEGSLYRIGRELATSMPELDFESLVASVRDKARMSVLFERYKPEVVFHAAAHKHVPLMEAHPEEAVLNNVVGTRNVVEVALASGVERFVNVSSDKAVNPTSVMGASKRLAECLVKAAARSAAPGQRFVSVRFGNVLGSSGSVVPLFKKQIVEGGPITLTDKRMTRYFMTIPEAAQLVLQAGALAENGATYILDMGQPVRILDLAEDLIRLSGLEPYQDIDIVEVGARPGEKLHEELVQDAEEHGRAVHEKIFVAMAEGRPTEELNDLVDRLEAHAYAGHRDAVISLLQERDDEQVGVSRKLAGP